MSQAKTNQVSKVHIREKLHTDYSTGCPLACVACGARALVVLGAEVVGSLYPIAHQFAFVSVS